MSGYTFDENGVKRIVSAVRRVEKQPLSLSPGATPIGSGTPINWLPGYNASGETIPPYSCVRIGEKSDKGGVEHNALYKPGTTFSREYGLTVGHEIDYDGLCGFSVEAGFATYDTGTPAVGETWGPKPGQWTLAKGYPGFRCLGVVDAANKIMLAVREDGSCRGFTFTLYDSFGDHGPDFKKALATVDHWWGAKPNDDDEFGHTFVFDEQHLFRRAMLTAPGIAIWDSRKSALTTEKNPGGLYRVIECGSKAGWIEFTLDAKLRPGYAAAFLDNVAGSQQDLQVPLTEYGKLTVWDDDNLFRSALPGAKGRAFYNAIADKYVVAECQSKAGWIIATLTYGSLTVSAVDDYGGTQQDIQEPDAVTLRDPLGLVAAAQQAGDPPLKVFAIYEAVGDTYVVCAVENRGKILIRVTLTQDRQAGDTTANSVGGAVVVRDTQGLFTRALNGAKGVAAWDMDAKRWELVECESKAGAVRFTLDADMTGGSAAASVYSYWGTQQDVQSPGSTVTVHDPAGLFPRAISGAKGVAIYDAVADQYIAVECQQEAILLTASLSADLHKGDATASVTGVAAVGISPFNQLPTVTTAANLYQLCGASGSAVLLVAKGDGSYILAQIAHVGITIPSGIRYSANRLEYKEREISVPLVEAESSWTLLVEAVDCTPS